MFQKPPASSFHHVRVAVRLKIQEFQMPFTRLVCCATVLLGVSVEGFRPSAWESTVEAETRDDVCCCKSTIEEYKPMSSTETHVVPMQDYHCKRFKQVRPDRPFWWWGSKCCWTSGFACTPTIGFLMMHNDGGDKVSDGTEMAKWCPVSSQQGGAVGPVDPTMAYNQNIEYLNTKIMTTLIQNAAGFAHTGDYLGDTVTNPFAS